MEISGGAASLDNKEFLEREFEAVGDIEGAAGALAALVDGCPVGAPGGGLGLCVGRGEERAEVESSPLGTQEGGRGSDEFESETRRLVLLRVGPPRLPHAGQRPLGNLPYGLVVAVERHRAIRSSNAFAGKDIAPACELQPNC